MGAVAAAWLIPTARPGRFGAHRGWAAPRDRARALLGADPATRSPPPRSSGSSRSGSAWDRMGRTALPSRLLPCRTVAVRGPSWWSVVGPPLTGRQTATPAPVPSRDQAPLWSRMDAASLPEVMCPATSWKSNGAIHPPPDSPYGQYLQRIGADGTLRADAMRVRPSPDSPGRALEGLRRSAGAALTTILPEPEAGLAAGILIGLRDLVDRDLAAAAHDGRRSHVAAISRLASRTRAGCQPASAGRLSAVAAPIRRHDRCDRRLRRVCGSVGVGRPCRADGRRRPARPGERACRAGGDRARLGRGAPASRRSGAGPGRRPPAVRTRDSRADRVATDRRGPLDRSTWPSTGLKLTENPGCRLCRPGRCHAALGSSSPRSGVCRSSRRRSTSWWCPSWPQRWPGLGLSHGCRHLPTAERRGLQVAAILRRAGLGPARSSSPMSCVSSQPPVRERCARTADGRAHSGPDRSAHRGPASSDEQIPPGGRGAAGRTTPTPPAPAKDRGPRLAARRWATDRWTTGRWTRTAAVVLAVVVLVAGAVVAARPAGVARITVMDVGQGDAIPTEENPGGRLPIDGGPDLTCSLACQTGTADFRRGTGGSTRSCCRIHTRTMWPAWRRCWTDTGSAASSNPGRVGPAPGTRPGWSG